MKDEVAIGVIGGSGLYEMEGLEHIERVSVSTPYGDPSDAYVTGTLFGRKMVFLPRHGVGHRFLPHEINFRANVWGMKKLGVGEIVSVSAVGSMVEEIRPGDLVLVDQFIDLTKRRASSFFGDGAAAHVAMADPVCPDVRRALLDARGAVSGPVHDGGTYVCIEGPQFSTRAESRVYRTWGVDVIGMTNMPEAKLAREAEICYATVALATDYDCWHESEDDVSVEAILQILRSNVDKAKSLISRFVQGRPAVRRCPLCPLAARAALMTPASQISVEKRRALEPIIPGLKG